MYAIPGYFVFNEDDVVIQAALNIRANCTSRAGFAEYVTRNIDQIIKEKIPQQNYPLTKTNLTFITALFKGEAAFHADIVHLLCYVLRASGRLDGSIPRVGYRQNPVLGWDEVVIRSLRGCIPTPRFPKADVRIQALEITNYMTPWLNDLNRMLDFVYEAHDTMFLYLCDVYYRVSKGQAVSQFDKTLLMMAHEGMLKTRFASNAPVGSASWNGAEPVDVRFVGPYSAAARVAVGPPSKEGEVEGKATSKGGNFLIAMPLNDPVHIARAAALPGLVASGPGSNFVPWFSTRQRTSLLSYIGMYAPQFMLSCGDFKTKIGAFHTTWASQVDEISYSVDDLIEGVAQSGITGSDALFAVNGSSLNLAETTLKILAVIEHAGRNPAIAPRIVVPMDEPDIGLIATGPSKDRPDLQYSYISSELRRTVETTKTDGYVLEKLLNIDRLGAGGVEMSTIESYDFVDLRALEPGNVEVGLVPRVTDPAGRIRQVQPETDIVIATQAGKPVTRRINLARISGMLEKDLISPALSEYVRPPIEWLMPVDERVVSAVAARENLTERQRRRAAQSISVCWNAWRMRQMFNIEPALPMRADSNKEMSVPEYASLFMKGD